MTIRGARARPARPHPMPYLRLSPDVGFCRIRGAAIFLDLKRDRYFQLTDEAEAAFAPAAARPDIPLSDAEADRLLKTGLFVPSDEPCTNVPARTAAIERSLAEDSDRVPAAWSLLPAVLIGLVRTKRTIRRGGLRRLVEEQRRAKALPCCASPSASEQLAQTFLAARRLVPIRPNCLLDSLTLVRFLRARSASADLVFGVKLQPFGAHCWVQREGTILNDSVGNASDFTPVLVA